MSSRVSSKRKLYQIQDVNVSEVDGMKPLRVHWFAIVAYEFYFTVSVCQQPDGSRHVVGSTPSYAHWEGLSPNTPLLDMVKSLYLLETLYGIRVSHSVTMDQYIHSVSFDLSTKCRRSSDGRLGVCDFKPMRINDGSPEIAANWLQQPKKRKQTRQKWKFSSVKQTKQTRKDNHKFP